MSELDIIPAIAYFNPYMQPSQQLSGLKIVRRASSQQRITAGVFCAAVVISCVFVWLAVHYKIGIWPAYCGFKQRYNLPCPTCGMTTAAIAFARGRIFQAFYIQPAGALLCCILVVSVVLAFITSVFGWSFRFVDRFFAEVKIRYIILVIAIIIALGWAVTLTRALAGNY